MGNDHFPFSCPPWQQRFFRPRGTRLAPTNPRQPAWELGREAGTVLTTLVSSLKPCCSSHFSVSTDSFYRVVVSEESPQKWAFC